MQVSLYIIKHCSSRENTHIVESLNKVCDVLMQNTTVQSQQVYWNQKYIMDIAVELVQ